MKHMRYILASASPRRRELLSHILSEFEIIPAASEEVVDKTLPPEEIARSLAEHKCSEVFSSNTDAVVIACDTIVVFGGEILGKPKNAEDAKETIRKLSGKIHFVITGVCIRAGGKKISSFEKTEVKFNNLSDEFISAYVAGGSPLDKAGSYGIQDEGVVKEYFGSYTNVVGMPVRLVKNMLERIKQ